VSWLLFSALQAGIFVRIPLYIEANRCFTLLTLSTASNPTTSSGGNEKSVAKVPGSEPWVTGKDAHYQYYPYGDTSAEKKDAPSPLHISIIPNVNLPKVRIPPLIYYCTTLTVY
jgi:hypothetical protein